MYFIQKRLKFVWHQNRKSHYDLWIFVVRFCYIRHERIFFFCQDQKKRGIIESFMKTSSLDPTHLLNFILLRKEGERYKNVARNVTYE